MRCVIADNLRLETWNNINRMNPRPRELLNVHASLIICRPIRTQQGSLDKLRDTNVSICHLGEERAKCQPGTIKPVKGMRVVAWKK